LGGEDFDNAILKHLVSEFKKQVNISFFLKMKLKNYNIVVHYKVPKNQLFG
jgi:molecular chaperone DnaK (HSP70)